MAMNKEWVVWNLKEAQKELTRTIADLESDSEYDYPEFSVAMAHLYHHLNTAWNSRDVSEQVASECSQENFDRWRQMPTDILLCSE
jgi:hypothetical protein